MIVITGQNTGAITHTTTDAYLVAFSPVLQAGAMVPVGYSTMI